MSDAIMNLLTSSAAQQTNIKVKSALNPVLWILSFIFPVCVSLAIWADPWLKVVAVIILFSAIVAAFTAYFYFMIKDPSKLQSENFQIQKMMLDIVQQQGSAATTKLLDIVASPNEEPLMLNQEEST